MARCIWMSMEQGPRLMFSWFHIMPTGRRVRRKRQVGTLDQYKTELPRNERCEAGDWPSTQMK